MTNMEVKEKRDYGGKIGEPVGSSSGGGRSFDRNDGLGCGLRSVRIRTQRREG